MAEEAPGGACGERGRQLAAPTPLPGDGRCRGRSGSNHPQGQRRPQTCEPDVQGQPVPAARAPRGGATGSRVQDHRAVVCPFPPSRCVSRSYPPAANPESCTSDVAVLPAGLPPAVTLTAPWAPHACTPRHTKDKYMPASGGVGQGRETFRERRKMSERGRGGAAVW